jgi:N-acetylglucosamine-6-phosphate deacetylase
MASAVPAAAMRRTDIGVLEAGRSADFVVLDDQLVVLEAWVSGRRVTRDAA